MHLNFFLKWALHFSTLVTTRFNSGTKLIQAAIITATLRSSLLLYHLYNTLTFKAKVLHLVGSVYVVRTMPFAAISTANTVLP